MMVFLLLIVLVLIVVGAFYYGRSQSSKANSQNGERADGESTKGGHVPTTAAAPLTFATIKPGDAVVFWDDSSALVETVFDCTEHLGERTTSWRWIFLSDGRLVESTRDSRSIYSAPTVFNQGSAPFANLVADADQGGVLKTFEERVRESSVAAHPVAFIYDGVRYRMRSTGVFVAQVSGKAPDTGPWADVSGNEGDNVYFKMSFGDAGQTLGIWTQNILFMTGKELEDSEIKGLYGK